MVKMPDSAILVETTILVDLLRRSVPAADYLDVARTQADLLCSAVTKAELIIGSKTRTELRAIDQLLARFQIEPITAHDSARALKWLSKYYHAHGVGFHDCLICAVAVRRHIPVATLNERHFKVLPGVMVLRPY